MRLTAQLGRSCARRTARCLGKWPVADVRTSGRPSFSCLKGRPTEITPRGPRPEWVCAKGISPAICGRRGWQPGGEGFRGAPLDCLRPTGAEPVPLPALSRGRSRILDISSGLDRDLSRVGFRKSVRRSADAPTSAGRLAPRLKAGRSAWRPRRSRSRHDQRRGLADEMISVRSIQVCCSGRSLNAASSRPRMPPKSLCAIRASSTHPA